MSILEGLDHRRVSARELRRMAMVEITESEAALVLRAADGAFCNSERSAGLGYHEVAIAGHWGNVEQVRSLLPESVRAAGVEDGNLSRRELRWQVKRG